MRVVPPYVHMMMLAHARGAWRRVCLAQDGFGKGIAGATGWRWGWRWCQGDGPYIFRGAVQPPHPALRATFSPPGRRDSVVARRFLSKPQSLHEILPLAPSSPLGEKVARRAGWGGHGHRRHRPL